MRFGECWIEDGDVWSDTGGDGQYNHEGYALNHARRLLFNALGIDNDRNETKETAQVIEKFLEDEEFESSGMDVVERLRAWMEQELSTDVGLIDAAFDHVGDIREYAMSCWDWKWVKERWVGTHTLTTNDLEIIRDGYSEIVTGHNGLDFDDPEINDEEIEISVASSGDRHVISLRDLLDRKWEALLPTTPAMEATFSAQVQAADAALMHPHYEGKLGD